MSFWVPGPVQSDAVRKAVRATPLFVHVRALGTPFLPELFFALGFRPRTQCPTTPFTRLKTRTRNFYWLATCGFALAHGGPEYAAEGGVNCQGSCTSKCLRKPTSADNFGENSKTKRKQKTIIRTSIHIYIHININCGNATKER